MALKTVLGEQALAPAAQAPGTYVSGPIANAGYAQWVDILVHCSAITSSPTVDVHVESSPDNVTWTQIPGTVATQLVAVGHARCSAFVNANYVRVTSTVGGTGTATYGVAVVVIPE